MDGNIEDGDFWPRRLGEGGRSLGERNKLQVSVEVTVEDVFLTFGRFERMSSLKDPSDFGLLLYDGVISDEEFVLLYNEI